MRILIIEDEQRTADQIIRLIKQYDNTFSVSGVIDSVEKGIEWFMNKKEPPDLLLVDIQLSDGTSFDLFDQVNVELPVIFITAYNEYALHAFRMNSVDYLLKPLNFADLKKALDKFIKIKESYRKIDLREYNRSILSGQNSYKRRFLVKSGNNYKYIITDEIASFTVENGLVFAVLLIGSKSIVDQSIVELSRILDPEKFFQINRNTIANIGAIYKMANYFNRRVIVQLLPDKHEVVVSRERVQDFKQWLNR